MPGFQHLFTVMSLSLRAAVGPLICLSVDPCYAMEAALLGHLLLLFVAVLCWILLFQLLRLQKPGIVSAFAGSVLFCFVFVVETGFAT